MTKSAAPALPVTSPVISPAPVIESISPPNPEILSAEDVAKLLGVDLPYIFEKTRSRCSNPLPSHSLGRYLRFFKHEVLAWLAAQPSERPKRSYRLSPSARKGLIKRNRERAGRAA
jgi:predicted DNA-binding transcriptional regulator AlpA